MKIFRLPERKFGKKQCFFSYEASQSNLAKANFPELTFFIYESVLFDNEEGRV